MSVAEDIAAKIILAGLGVAVNRDIFLGSKAKMPSLPSNVGPYISLIDTGGTAAIRTHTSRYPRPSMQIVVRATSAVVAKERAVAIHALLCSLTNVTLSATVYLSVREVQEVLDMQTDEVGRARFGFNLNFLKTQ